MGEAVVAVPEMVQHWAYDFLPLPLQAVGILQL
jgi:hypothetical protein